MWAWSAYEARSRAPLVDVSLMRNRALLTLNVIGAIAGAGMYLLLSLAIRYVQTPASAGYGFGATVLVAGCVLIPFSVLSVLSNKMVIVASRVISERWILACGCLSFATALVVFRFATTQFWEVFLLMGLAGLGVGFSFSAIPLLIMRAVPPELNGGALGLNQLFRFIGFALGSALSATILEAFEDGGAIPTRSGYDLATEIGVALWVGAALVAAVFVKDGSQGRH